VGSERWENEKKRPRVRDHGVRDHNGHLQARKASEPTPFHTFYHAYSKEGIFCPLNLSFDILYLVCLEREVGKRQKKGHA